MKLSKQAIEELKNSRANRQVQLSNAYTEMGGSNAALKPSYALADPYADVKKQSLPVLEKAFVNQYEKAETNNLAAAKPIISAAAALSNNPIMRLAANKMPNIQDAKQANARLYNDIKVKEIDKALQSINQVEQARGKNSALVEDFKRTGGSLNPKDYNSIGDYFMNAPYSTQAALSNTAQDILNKAKDATSGDTGLDFLKHSPLTVGASLLADKTGVTGTKGILTPEMEALGLTEKDLELWNKAQNEKERKNVLSDWAKRHGIAATINAIPENAFGSIANVLDKAKAYLKGEVLEEKPTNADIYRQTVSENINLGNDKATNLARLGYGGLNSLGDMAFAALLSAPLGGAGASAKLTSKGAAGLMGLEKASETMNDAISRGLDPNQVMAEGALSGISTAITEALPFEKFAKGGNVLGAMLSEGLQEGSEDLVDTLFDELITRAGGNNEKSSYNLMYQSYIDAGYSEEEAKRATVNDYIKQVGIDAALGGITGGIMGAGGNLMQGNRIFSGKPRNIPSLDVNENVENVNENANSVIPEEEEQHTPVQNRVIKEYKNSIDKKLATWIKARRNGETRNYPIPVAKVTNKVADFIKNEFGISTYGNDVVMNNSSLAHIDKHKESSDKSPITDEDIARIGYVLENPDEIAKTGRVTSGTRLSDNSYAPTFIMRKRIDGHYYVVEAATDAKSKNNVVITAFIEQAGKEKGNIKDLFKESHHVPNALAETSPLADVRNAHDLDSSAKRVPQVEKNVNNGDFQQNVEQTEQSIERVNPENNVLNKTVQEIPTLTREEIEAEKRRINETLSQNVYGDVQPRDIDTNLYKSAADSYNTMLREYGQSENALAIAEDINRAYNDIISAKNATQQQEAIERFNYLTRTADEALENRSDDLYMNRRVYEQNANPDTSSITDRRENRDLLNLAQQYKDKLSMFEDSDYKAEAKSLNKAIDNAIESNDMQALRDTLANVDSVMSNAEVGTNARKYNKEALTQMQQATDGYKIKVSPELLHDLNLDADTVSKLDTKYANTGSRNRIHFVSPKNENGVNIDAVYDEIADKSGGVLPKSGSMNQAQMLSELINYINNPKAARGEMTDVRGWNDVSLFDNRSEGVIEAENLSDTFVDNIINGNIDNYEESFSDFMNQLTELANKYPEESDNITGIMLSTYKAIQDMPRSTVKLDDDIKAVDNLEDAVSMLEDEAVTLSQTLNYFSEESDASDNETEDLGRVNTGRKKTSKTYPNTGLGSGIMTEEEQTLHNIDDSMLYEENSEKESVAEAHKRIRENGTVNERKRLLNKNGFNNVDVDEAMTLWKQLSDKIRQLKEKGLDYQRELKQAHELFTKITEEASSTGSALQALAKWSRNNTPEGLLAEATAIINKAKIGKNGRVDWYKETAKETKRKTAQMDIDFMDKFLTEADNLYSGDWNDVKRITDNYTIKINPKMLKALGFNSLSDLNKAVWTDTTNSIRFTYGDVDAKGQKVIKPLAQAYAEMYKKAGDIFTDPDKISETAMLRDLVKFITTKGQMINLDSRKAKHVMANLGKLVNSQIPITLREKITTLLMDNMLGNARTLITRNAGGNIGFNVLEEFLRKPLAAKLDSAIYSYNKKHGKIAKRTTMGLSKAGIKAGWEGFKEALGQEAYDFKNDIQSARSGENTLANATANNRNALTSKIGHMYNKLVKAGLSVGDRPFYEFVYNQSMVEYKKLYDEGLLGDMSEEDFNELAKANAQLNALTAVYQDNSQIADAFLKMKEAVNDLSQGIVGADVLSQFTMPFVKTPANIIARSIEYSPIGIVKNAIQTLREINSKEIDFNQGRFVNESARNLIGTVLFGASLALANAGKMTGGYSDDKDMRQAQKEAGMQEFALHNPFGINADVDVSWIPVIGNNLVAGASAYDAMSKPELSIPQMLSQGATSGLKSQFESSMLQGLQRLVGGSGSFGNDGGDLLSNAVDTLKSGATQFIPSLLRQAASATDPYQRQLSGANPDDYYKNSVLSAIPGLREQLQPKISRTGKELEQNHSKTFAEQLFNNFINPATVTYGTPDAVRDEAMRLFESTGNNVAFQPTVTISELKSDDHVPTAQEYTDYQRNAYGAMNSIASDVIGSDYYQSLSDGDKEQLLANIYSSVKSVEKAKILGKDTSSFSGAEKAYYEDGADGLIRYMTARQTLNELGLQNNQTNRDKVYEKLDEGGTEAVQEMVQQAQELQDAGLDTNMQFKYEHAANYLPSLTPTEFADTWNDINTDNNTSIKQSEVIDYLNQNPDRYTDETALQYWNAFDQKAGHDGAWKKIPVLNSETGLWEAKQGTNGGTTTRSAATQTTANTNTKDKYGIGQYGKGNIDLYARPQYRYPDGSVATVESMSFNIDGKEVLIPTIAYDSKGRAVKLTDDQAIQRYYDTGEYLGKFDTVKEADNYANKLHLQQEELYSK